MTDEDGADDTCWDEAVRREAAVSNLVRQHWGRLTVRAVDTVALELDEAGKTSSSSAYSGHPKLLKVTYPFYQTRKSDKS
jgi:hypothetical protein